MSKVNSLWNQEEPTNYHRTQTKQPQSFMKLVVCFSREQPDVNYILTIVIRMSGALNIYLIILMLDTLPNALLSLCWMQQALTLSSWCWAHLASSLLMLLPRPSRFFEGFGDHDNRGPGLSVVASSSKLSGSPKPWICVSSLMLSLSDTLLLALYWLNSSVFAFMW